MTDMKKNLDALSLLIERRDHTIKKLEREELDLIEAARASGASWDRIAQTLGIRTRQGAQQRHTALIKTTKETDGTV